VYLGPCIAPDGASPNGIGSQYDGIDAAGEFAACAAMYYELADAGRAMGKDPLEIEGAEERGDGARQVARRLLYRATGEWGAAKADIDEHIVKARRVWRSQLRKEGGISPSCLSDMSKCLQLSDMQEKLLAEMRANPLD
jgi:hypothetical protein